jgi:threonine dehydrogenase-like Zn-dependent dehydrogenase
MCRNGRYTEHGIRALDGFGRERFALEPAFAVRVPAELGALAVLVEPASVLAKAWEQVQRIGARAPWRMRKVLVTGAGPVGLLAALLATQLDLDVHVLDRVTGGPKPELVRGLGATYHTGDVAAAGEDADVVIECTGAASVVFDAIGVTRRTGIVCLTGLSSGGRALPVDVGELNRRMVLENDVVFGSVNANRRHYQAAALALARADERWLGRLITRRLPLERWAEALAPDAGVKTVVEFPGFPGGGA